jgi:hypothetical protein
VPTSTYTNLISNPPATLPQTNSHGAITDTPSADGKYYYTVSGTVNSALAISPGASVVMIFTTPSGSDSIKLTGGNDNITIGSSTAGSAAANLAIYTAGDVKIAGKGVINNNATGNTTSFQLWSTNTSDPATAASGTHTQSIDISGNGSLVGTVYAPNASLSVKGGGNATSGDVYGSFVAYSVSMTGNDSFHYDMNLARTGTGGTYSPTKWRELVASTDRATYATQLNF